MALTGPLGPSVCEQSCEQCCDGHVSTATGIFFPSGGHLAFEVTVLLYPAHGNIVGVNETCLKYIWKLSLFSDDKNVRTVPMCVHWNSFHVLVLEVLCKTF